MSKKKFFILMCGIIALAILLDQVTKIVMANALQNDKVIPVIGNWLVFSFTKNYGAAFGSLTGKSVLFFIATVLGIPAFFVFMMFNRKESLFGNVGLAFVVGGAMGNAIDRAIFAENFFDGYVRDFVAVEGFAIFNVADSFLTVGVIMFAVAIIFFDNKKIEEKKKEANE